MLKRVLQSALLLTLLLPLVASAVGFGQFNVRSALGQPLDATIELIGIDADEATLMSVGAASVARHEKQGIERPYWIALFKFVVETNSAGQPFIKVTSSDPVREPYLNFLIEGTWSSGRLIKEMTAFIDPPTLAAPTAVAISTPTAVAPTPAAPTGPGDSAADIMMSSNPADQRYDRAAASFAPTRYGDTLWAIANEIDSGSATPEQTLLGLIALNQGAFIAGNINNLMAGKTLAVPSESEFLAIPVDVASDRVQLHNERWQRAKTGLPLGPMPPLAGVGQTDAAVVSAGQVQREISSQTASADSGAGETVAGSTSTDVAADEQLVGSAVGGSTGDSMSAQPSEPAAEQSAGATAQLKLLGGGDGGVDAEGMGAAGDVLDATLVAGDELKSQVAALEEQLQDMQRLLVLKDEKLRLVEEQAAAGGGDREVGLTTSAVAADDSLSTLLNNPVVLGALLVLLILLLVLLIAVVLLVRKLGQQTSEPLADIAQPKERAPVVALSGAGEALQAAVVAEDEPAQLGDQTADETLAQESELGFTSNMVSAAPLVEDVDPLAEAEVYLAYGRHQQAEEIIQEAVQADPERLELKLKLLEIYYTQRKQDEFEQQAELVEPLVAVSNADLWNDIRVMGHDLSPDHSLFADVADGQSVSGSLVGDSAFSDVLEIGLDDASAGEESSVETLDFGGGDEDLNDEVIDPTLTTEIGVGDNVVDFDLGAPLSDFATEPGDEVASQDGIHLDLEELSGEGDSTAVELEDGGLDFDLGSNDFEIDEEIELTEVGEDEADSLDLDLTELGDDKDDGSEFDLDLTEVGEDDGLEFELDITEVGEDEDDSLDLDLTEVREEDSLDLEDGEVDVEIADPMSSKLDLARAYIEMGDKDAARDLLASVESQGDDEQAAEARRMRAELSI